MISAVIITFICLFIFILMSVQGHTQECVSMNSKGDEDVCKAAIWVRRYLIGMQKRHEVCQHSSIS